ncbi:hypothetical protein H2204_001697 [Knufia peltigerae]|uniref:Fructose-bisphosphate aldolase n=1 Tax=Knufia peltigerae TaxID=1002370 RepID=A0AA38YCQ9_9EURO|nr:hypothetical protein H2204_001697 [Knufia peltigerae]
MIDDSLANNLTRKIIQQAKSGGYAVGGFCVFAADRAHAASVPISLHLDHCLKPSDAYLALECAFDSIMIDGSMFDEEENIRYVRSIVERAKAKNITIEAELGRMEGKEDGVPQIDLETVWTDPKKAASFVRETGVHFLAPSFGNVHGPYGPGGAEKHWQLDRLMKIYEKLGDRTPLVLHGTHPLSDDLVRVAMRLGMVKINQNRSVRNKYHEYLANFGGKGDLIALQENAVEAYSQDIERVMTEVFMSAGKA